MNFIFDKPSYYHTDVNIIPWLFSYNTYNGFTPGFLHGMVFYLGMGVILQQVILPMILTTMNLSVVFDI